MILILEDDADREQYQRMYPLNPEFLNPDTMRPATVWISPEAYEEKVRADERERQVAASVAVNNNVRRISRARFRAQVVALGHDVDCHFWDTESCNCWNADVLALVDGSSDA